MSLAVNKCRETRGAIPVEFAQMAAKELAVFRHNIGSHSDLIQEVIRPRKPNHAEAFNIAPYTERQIVSLEDVAPTVMGIIDQLAGTEVGGEYRSFFPGVFTVNYALPGQVVPTHVDSGNEGPVRKVSVVTLSGIGNFVLNPNSPQEETLEDLVAGDMHEFNNPGNILDRPPHGAINTGDTERITIAYQVLSQ